MRKVLFLFGQLSDTDLVWLFAAGTKQRIAPGTVLIQQGQRIDTLYILMEGTLEVSGPQIGEQPIRLSYGEVVGEVSLLDSRPTTATVTAATECVVLAMPRARLTEKLAQDAPFAARFYRALAMFLAHRLRGTYQRLGYGKEHPLREDVQYEDELSPEMLDSVHIAGSRFDQSLRRLLSE